MKDNVSNENKGRGVRFTFFRCHTGVSDMHSPPPPLCTPVIKTDAILHI